MEDFMKLNRIASIAAFALFAITLMWSQTNSAPRHGTPNYDPKTETTVKGIVEENVQQTGPGGWGGTHLIVKTETGTVEVHVGPTQYIAAQGFSFAKGDKVEVTGSQLKMGSTNVIIAREVKKDDKVLTLRDAQGFPKWSGMGHGR
jgi:hypothetical protein